MSFKKILIVEENPSSLNNLRKILQGHGHRVVSAPDSDSLVERAIHELPDLVLMGMGKSGGQGAEAKRKLREEPRTSSIPVIAIAAPNTREDQRILRNIGCDKIVDYEMGREGFVDLVGEALRIDGIYPSDTSDVFTPSEDLSCPPETMVGAGVVLVVDDEERNRNQIGNVLEPLGYVVRQAQCGDDALASIMNDPPELILVDCNMPDVDGLELTRRIRKNPATRTTPILLLTTFSDQSRKMEGIEAGCDDFIDKPFDGHDLITRVRTLFRLGQGRSYEEEHQRYDKMLSEMGEGIVYLDGGWNITEMTGPALLLLDLPPDGYCGVNLLDHVCADRSITPGRSQVEREENDSIRFEIRRKETNLSAALALSVFARRLRTDAGAIREIILAVKDISENDNRERMQDEFLSTISHKFKTPLSVIMANVEHLKGGLFGELSRDQEEAIREIGIGGGHLLDLFDKLLAFIAPSSIDVPYAVPQEVGTFLVEYVAELRECKRNQAVEFKCSIDENVMDATIGFPSFKVALNSIVENAVKFNPAPGAMVSIEAARGTGSSLVFTVTDNGPGIPSEHTEMIFRKFYQVEKFHTGSVTGVGLGLPLARRLIERLGGTVEVESRLNEGTTFRITLSGGAPPDIDS